MRKDYEVARYQRLTKPLIELSDDVVDIDNFALPLKKNWFLELLTQKQRIGIYERFLQLIKNISSILALFYKNHPNLKILHINFKRFLDLGIIQLKHLCIHVAIIKMIYGERNWNVKE